ncbi:GDP-mannose transporter into the lumen of the Golgi [Sporothrix bragantina]|uniref:GDP-mannose transporter n=1 Tax=Sporothrix bragantina TaxID=671064 RepID=A0ABP0CKM5_9PEZI
MTDKKNEDYVAIRMNNLDAPGRNPLRSYNAPSSPVTRPWLGFDIANSPGASVIAYCLASISMTVVNKYLVSGTYWNMNSLYLAFQSLVCVLTVYILSLIGAMPKLETITLRNCRTFLPMGSLLVGMIYTGAKALQYLSVPVYTIFKNLAIIVVAYGEVLWFGGRVTPLALLSFGLMVFSSVIAAWTDIQTALTGTHPAVATDVVSTLNLGYAWMFANVMCSAAFVLGMRRLTRNLQFKDRDTMFYNNMMSIPILILLSLLTEDWSAENLARNFPSETRNSQMVGILYSGFMAIGISYCSAWCVRVTSSTTYSMVGALNKLPIALSGLVFFGTPATFGSVSAIIIGFVAGLVYSWAKIRKTQVEAEKLPTAQPVMSASSMSNKDAVNA